MGKAPRRRDDEYTPEPPPLSADAKEALGHLADIEYLIKEKFDRDTLEKGGDFFDSVLEKAQAIGKTVKRSGTCSTKQLEAMERMCAGVKKWDHENDEDDD